MAKVIVCEHSVTTWSKRKQALFESVNEGFQNKGFKSKISKDHVRGGPYDIAVMFGYVIYRNQRPVPGPRISIIENQKRTHNQVMCMDDAHMKFAYGDRLTKIGFNSPFYNSGLFYARDKGPKRWNQKFAKYIEIHDWRRNGSHILLMLQNSKNFSMKGKNTLDWALETITKIRKYSDRKIIIRPHPKMPFTKEIIGLFEGFSSLEISDGKKGSLARDLEDCWAAFTYSSGSAIESCLRGVPTFISSGISMATPVCNKNIADIENPKFFDRFPWLCEYSNCIWTDEELRSGDFWDNLKEGYKRFGRRY